MSLARTLDAIFDNASHMRGAGLFGSGAVRIKDAGPRHVYGVVTDGIAYDVRMTLEDGELLVWCGCAFFRDHGPCRHLWAMVLAGDAHGVPAEALGSRFLNVADESEFDEYDHDHEDGGEDDGFLFPPASRRLVPPPPPRIPDWVDQLEAVERKLGPRSGRSRSRSATPRSGMSSTSRLPGPPAGSCWRCSRARAKGTATGRTSGGCG